MAIIPGPQSTALERKAVLRDVRARTRAAARLINVMTYDFYGPWSAHAGLNSPLFQDPPTGTGRQ